jgi:2-polyprenyl-3-methyl-5-hydroxy-6-metoxy-1,4-benzoquinol methylase
MSWQERLYFRLLYFRKPPWDTQVSPPELMDFIAQHPPGRALDLGCGTGTNVITLAQHGWQVTGVDFVGRALNKARTKAQLAGVSVDFQLDDVTKLEHISGCFDLVLDIGCFHSLSVDEKKAYIQNLERLTSPGSCYLLYGFSQSNGGGGPGIQSLDLRGIENSFNLSNQVEGTDRNERSSMWLTFHRKLVD